MEKPVSTLDLQKLRKSGTITSEEIAIVVGDIIIAENVITKERRTIETHGLMLESNRTLLRG
jgi:hypothetical protein